MNRTSYSSDINDDQWKVIEPLIPPAKPGGRPRSVDMREILNAIFYVVRSGCAWRLIPHCLLYTSDAADDLLCVDLGGRRIINKKKDDDAFYPYGNQIYLILLTARNNQFSTTLAT